MPIKSDIPNNNICNQMIYYNIINYKIKYFNIIINKGLSNIIIKTIQWDAKLIEIKDKLKKSKILYNNMNLPCR